jgi:hypothetical protein
MKPIDKRYGLTAKRIRKLLDYDPTTGVLRWRVRVSYNVFAGRIAGRSRSRGYYVVMIGNRTYAAHRLIWLHVIGHWPKEELDHINGNTFDNRFCNLREATRTENRRNNHIAKGIQQQKNRFRARIWINGKNVHLGCFATEHEARHAYLIAAKKHFGEFGVA